MRSHFPSYLPLIVFTGVFPVAVGLILPAAVVVCVPGLELEASWHHGPAHATLVFVPAAGWIAALALAVAGLHLGRKLRAPLAVLGVGRSWLSAEVLLAGLFVLLAVFSGRVVMWYHIVDMTDRVALVLQALVGLAAVIALVRVYALPGQVGWRGLDRSAAPLVATALTAVVVWWATADAECATAASTLLVVVLVLDTALAAVRSARLIRARRGGDPAIQHARAARLAGWLVPARFGAVVLLVLALRAFDPDHPLGSGSPMPWVVVILLGVSLLDRFVFYAGATRSSPRAAITRLRRERLDRAAASVDAAQPRVGR